MTTKRTPYSSAYDEQIQEIDRKLKVQNSRWPTFAAVFLLLGGIALLLLMDKNFNFPDIRTCAGLGTLLVVLFVLWEIREYRKAKCFAADFYGEMLPAVLKKAYAAYAPQTGDPAPLLFDPAETWHFPTTVTFLTLSINDPSFRTQGIYRIRADDVTQAELFLNTHGQQMTELRDNMGRFLLEYTDDMLTLSFSDFAPTDTKDSNGVRRTGLPGGLSAESVAESVRKLDFLSDWLRAFVKKDAK